MHWKQTGAITPGRTWRRAAMAMVMVVTGAVFGSGVGGAWRAAGAEPAGAVPVPPGWKQSQEIRVGRTGLVRVAVPVESLGAARAQLEDLRLLDEAGREVPYLVERPAMPRPRMLPAKRFTSTVLTDNTRLEIETGLTQAVAAVRLHSPASGFLKAVRVEGSSDGAAWRVLAEGRAIFRQRDGAEELSIALPSGTWPRLRLTVDDRRAAPVPFTAAELRVEAGPPAATEPLDVVVVGRTEEAGETRLQLRVAAANVVLAGLTLETPEPLFMRAVTLSSPRLVEGEVQPVVWARDTVFRSGPADGRAEAASRLVVGADLPLTSREIVLTVRNEDNPPLQITGVTATRRPVYLVFQAGGARHVLASGNSECAAPRYELAGLRSSLEGVPLAPLEVGPMTLNPAHRPVDWLASVPDVGAPLDVKDWAWRKSVLVDEAGWQQLELDLAVLARGGSSQSDLRLMRGGAQVPYLLERLPAPRRLPLSAVPADDPSRPGLSRWRVKLPEKGAPLLSLTVTSPAVFFERTVRLVEDRRDVRGTTFSITAASATWVRREGRGAGPLVLNLSHVPESDELYLEIDKGDNLPLAVSGVEGSHAAVRLLFKAAPGAPLHLYYGNFGASMPRYDLAAAVPRWESEGVRAVRARLGPEEAMKPLAASSRRWSAGGASWMFWAVLAAVVIGLLVIVARLLPPSGPAGGARNG